MIECLHVVNKYINVWCTIGIETSTKIIMTRTTENKSRTPYKFLPRGKLSSKKIPYGIDKNHFPPKKYAIIRHD